MRFMCSMTKRPFEVSRGRTLKRILLMPRVCDSDRRSSPAGMRCTGSADCSSEGWLRAKASRPAVGNSAAADLRKERRFTGSPFTRLCQQKSRQGSGMDLAQYESRKDAHCRSNCESRCFEDERCWSRSLTDWDEGLGWRFFRRGVLQVHDCRGWGEVKRLFA